MTVELFLLCEAVKGFARVQSADGGIQRNGVTREIHSSLDFSLFSEYEPTAGGLEGLSLSPRAHACSPDQGPDRIYFCLHTFRHGRPTFTKRR